MRASAPVRDVFTKEFLDSLGVSKHRLTGCPASFLFERDFRFNDNPVVVISFPPTRYRKHPVLFFRLIRGLRKYAKYCQGLGLRPVLACHTENDLPAARSLKPADVEPFYSENAQEYYALYQQARWVVGFRLHSSILSFTLGIPFIPIYFDVRGRSFAETYQSRGWAIDAQRWGLYRTLVRRTEEIMRKNTEPFERFLARQRHLQGEMHNFLDEALRPVAGC